MEKVYFSKPLDPNNWDDKDCGVINVFLVPRRWWSISQWRFAWSLRAKFLQQMIKMMRDE